MDSEKFVEAVREHAMVAAVADTMTYAQSPPGRRVLEDTRRRAEWIRSREPSELRYIEELVQLAAHTATFGVLAILDGVRSLDDSESRGKFILIYEEDDRRTVLNPEGGDFLHDIFNSEQPPK